MVTTHNGLIGRHVRIRVGLGSCFAVELVPILLLPTVDLTAQDWDDLYKAPSVSLWTAQVTWRVIYCKYLLLIKYFGCLNFGRFYFQTLFFVRKLV